jgi:hypothetical protein
VNISLPTNCSLLDLAIDHWQGQGELKKHAGHVFNP